MNLRRIVLLCLFSGIACAEEYQARAVIKAENRAVIASELASRVLTLPVAPGQTFKQGDILVGLDCALFKAQQNKIAAESKAADLTLENARQLNQLRSISTLDVAIAEAERDKAQASLAMAELNVARCTLKAPYDGRVVVRSVNRFESVRQHQPLIEIIDDQHLKAEMVAPAAWVRWLKNGLPVRLHPDNASGVVQASLSGITPAIDPASQTVVLHITIPSPAGLLPGMSATAEIVRISTTKPPVDTENTHFAP